MSGCVLRDEVDRRVRVGGGADDLERVGRQPELQQVADVDVVVDDDDPQPRSRLLRLD